MQEGFYRDERFSAIQALSEVDGWRLAIAKYGRPATEHYREALRTFIGRNPAIRPEFQRYPSDGRQ